MRPCLPCTWPWSFLSTGTAPPTSGLHCRFWIQLSDRTGSITHLKSPPSCLCCAPWCSPWTAWSLRHSVDPEEQSPHRARHWTQVESVFSAPTNRPSGDIMSMDGVCHGLVHPCRARMGSKTSHPGGAAVQRWDLSFTACGKTLRIKPSRVGNLGPPRLWDCRQDRARLHPHSKGRTSPCIVQPSAMEGQMTMTET